MSMLLGKVELLHWVSHTLHLQITKYEELRDGFAFLMLASKLFPKFVDPSLIRRGKSGPRNADTNWQALAQCFQGAGIPLQFCEKKGVSVGHQKPCYNMLVMFYFLTKLKSNSEFAVDFAHPIDDGLAAFLQSPRSLECLAGVHVLPEAPSTGRTRSVSPAHPAPSPTPRAVTPQRTAPPTPKVCNSKLKKVSGKDEPQGSDTAGELYSSQSELVQQQLRIGQLSSEVKSLGYQLSLAEAEVTHVRKQQHHASDQHRILVESEMLRAAQQFHTQLVSAQLEAQYSIEKNSLECKRLLETDREVFDDENLLYRHDGGQGSEIARLKKANGIYEKKIECLEKALSSSDLSKKALQEQIDSQTASLERMYRVIQSVSKNVLPEQRSIDLPEGPLQLVLSQISALREEVESYKASSERHLEKCKTLENTIAEGKDTQVQIELSHAKRKLNELRSLNSHLQGLLTRSAVDHSPQKGKKCTSARQHSAEGMSMPVFQGDDDLFAERDRSVVIPSTCVGSVTLGHIGSDIIMQLATLEHSPAPEDFPLLREKVQRMVSASSIIHRRLEVSTKTLGDVLELQRNTARNWAIEKRRLESEVERFRCTEGNSGSTDTAVVAQLQMEIDLLKAELESSKKDGQEASRRLREHLHSLVSSNDRQLTQSKTEQAKLQRTVVSLVNREKIFTQLLSLLENRRSVDGREIETQVAVLKASLRNTPSHQEVETETLRREHSQKSVYEEIRGALEANEELRVEAASLRESLRRAMLEMDARKQGELQLRTERDRAVSDSSVLRSKMDQQEEKIASLEAQFGAERQAWKIVKDELEEFVSKVSAEAAEGGRHAGTYPSETEQKPTSMSLLRFPPDEVHDISTGIGSSVVPDESTAISAAAATQSPYVPALSEEDCVHQENEAGDAQTSMSSVLSPSQLEKRKQEILSKYGIGSSL